MVFWNDGLKSWVSLIDLKESYPIQLSEYAKVQEIEDEPTFAWWIPFLLKKRDNIVSSV